MKYAEMDATDRREYDRKCLEWESTIKAYGDSYDVLADEIVQAIDKEVEADRENRRQYAEIAIREIEEYLKNLEMEYEEYDFGMHVRRSIRGIINKYCGVTK